MIMVDPPFAIAVRGIRLDPRRMAASRSKLPCRPSQISALNGGH
jgi:hypothetical protein